ARVVWGTRSSNNCWLYGEGLSDATRGALIACFHAIASADPSTSLVLYTKSVYAIRTITYWAPQHALQGWPGSNVDVQQLCAAALRARTAPVELRLCSATVMAQN
ncbi:hypothetical protein FB107DRAFT_195314, partial [Schizophyllum commune]